MLSAQNINCTLLFTTVDSNCVCFDKRWSGGKLHQYFSSYTSYTKFPPRHINLSFAYDIKCEFFYYSRCPTAHNAGDNVDKFVPFVRARRRKKKMSFWRSHTVELFWFYFVECSANTTTSSYAWPSAGCKKVEFLTRLSLMWLQNIFLWLVEFILRLMIFILLWMK